MTETLQIDEIRIIQLHDAPKLLVEWSPRWSNFVTSIGPAFARSGPRLAGEAPFGTLSFRSMVGSLLLEALLFFVVIIIPRQIAQLRPYAAPRVQPYKVLYYSGDELPRVEDLGGSQSGVTGRAGGQEAHHNTQTIRVARGASLAPKIVDAPDLKLPASADAVANLLAFNSRPVNPSPPPVEGLHSSHTAPSLPANVVAPAPTSITRDQSRGALTLNTVVAPTPSVSAEASRTAPALNAAIVPPTPSVQSEHTLYTPKFESSIVAPAPTVSRDRTRASPSLSGNVIAPASANISRDQARSTPALTSSIVAPAPADVSHEVSPSRVQMNNPAVVPPPVSAPERVSPRTAKLNMPAPSVVAPPPSADSTHDLRRLESGNAGTAPQAVVPPPPTASNSGFVSNIIGKLFGTQDVVPPPPTVSSGSSSGTSRSVPTGTGTLAANVIPPPPSASGTGTSRSSGTPRGTALGTSIVPPPPSANGSDTTGAAGTGTQRRVSAGNSLGTNIVPPPPSIGASTTGASTSSGSGGNRIGVGNGPPDGLANNIVPPPPSIGSGPGLSGTGRKGSGLGGPGDVGSVLAPPKSEAGTGNGSGVVVSSQPGSKVGTPSSGGKGSLALSPSGGDKAGLGGSGAGASIGHGGGPGSGLAGEKSGAGKTGAGLGSDPDARAGISPTPGPGGAGTAPTGAPPVPGVDVRGGSTSNVVNLPSFGSDGSGAPNLPGRSPVKPNEGPAITIVATSRSGGAFDFYGKLPGDNYTVYVDTTIGTVVMQFAEVPSAAHAQAGSLTGPQGLRTDLPAGLPHARMVIKCQLDTSGNLSHLQVLEPGPAAMTAKVMAALPSWKFVPAKRGSQPVEVNAILGFNIDTNDRY